MSFLFGIIIVDTFAVATCINAIICFYIAFIFSIYFLKKDIEKTKIPTVFFVIGGITNFFDFLTNPIITLGIPAIVCFLLLKEKKVSSQEMFIIIIYSMVTWTLGYGIMWGTKWIITDILYNRDIVKNAIQQVLFRTGYADGGKAYSISVLYQRIMRYSGKYYIPLLEIILCFYLGIYVFKLYNKEKKLFKNFKNIYPVIVISILPIIWYIVLNNHSTIHAFFTYRNNIIFIIGIQIATLTLLDMCDKNKIRRKEL